jgi:hypothetical protein
MFIRNLRIPVRWKFLTLRWKNIFPEKYLIKVHKVKYLYKMLKMDRKILNSISSALVQKVPNYTHWNYFMSWDYPFNSKKNQGQDCLLQFLNDITWDCFMVPLLKGLLLTFPWYHENITGSRLIGRRSRNRQPGAVSRQVWFRCIRPRHW